MRKIIGIFILTLVIYLPTLCNASLMNNVDPETPQIPTITGPSSGELYKKYTYSITTSDPQHDDIYFVIRCSGCPSIFNTDWFKSGGTLKFNQCWCDFYQNTNPFIISAKAIDSKGHESGWAKFEVNITNLHNDSFPFSFVKQIFRTLLNRLIL